MLAAHSCTHCQQKMWPHGVTVGCRLGARQSAHTRGAGLAGAPSARDAPPGRAAGERPVLLRAGSGRNQHTARDAAGRG